MLTVMDLSVNVKFTHVFSILKTFGELNTAQLIMNKSTVLAHMLMLNVQVLGAVMISILSLLKSSLWIPMVMDYSMNMMILIMITSTFLLDLVIKMVITSLPNVKSTTVLLWLKTNLEKKTVQVMVLLIVKTHMSAHNVKVLGLVPILN